MLSPIEEIYNNLEPISYYNKECINNELEDKDEAPSFDFYLNKHNLKCECLEQEKLILLKN